MPPPSYVRPALARLHRLVALALLPVAAACSDSVAPADPVSIPAENHAIGALQVRATTEIVGAATPHGPAVLRTVVTLANQGAWPLVLQMPACPLRVGGHRLAARTDAAAFGYPGAPPFTNAGACVASIVEVTIPPGGTHDLAAAADLGALRAAVPAGRWFLLAEVRIDAERNATVRVRAGEVTL